MKSTPKTMKSTPKKMKSPPKKMKSPPEIEHPMAKYFKPGAEIEISSTDLGFAGSWFEGTVVQPPRSFKSVKNKVLVEYKHLMDEDDESQKLQEEVEYIYLRPPPPKDRGDRKYSVDDDVNAYYNDGWWEGIVTSEVAGENGIRYKVFFRRSREEIEFGANEMRVHREWIDEKWDPPLDDGVGDGLQMEIESTYSPGDLVEVKSGEAGYEGAWFGATVVEKLSSGKYRVQYLRLKDDDDTMLIEEANEDDIRPYPPEIEVIEPYEVLDTVDALTNDAWWIGVVSKVQKDETYLVNFTTTKEVLEYKHSELRLHQEWENGKWVVAPKAETL